MASEYTDSLGLNKQGDNENPDTWGELLNQEVIDLIEEAIVGNSQSSIVELDGAISDRTLEILDGQASDVLGTGTNKARCGVLRLQGALGNDIRLNLPTIYKTYIVNGAHTGFSVFLTHSGTATEIEVNPGDVVFVYTDATDIYLVSRAQGSSSTGDSLLATNNLSDLGDPKAAIDNLGLYPVGSIYTSTSSTAPETFLPGVWQAIGQGRVLMGAGTSSVDTNGESRTFAGGEESGEFAHTLTNAEIADHTHTLTLAGRQGNDVDGINRGPRWGADSLNTGNSTATTDSSGGGNDPFDILQPYLVVYMWERIS